MEKRRPGTLPRKWCCLAGSRRRPQRSSRRITSSACRSSVLVLQTMNVISRHPESMQTFLSPTNSRLRRVRIRWIGCWPRDGDLGEGFIRPSRQRQLPPAFFAWSWSSKIHAVYGTWTSSCARSPVKLLAGMVS